MTLAVTASAQVTVTNKGVEIFNTQSSIYFNGHYLHDSTSSIVNGGSIHFRGDLINNSQNRLFITNAGKVILDGESPQNVSGNNGIDFHKLQVNNGSGSVVLFTDIAVKDTLSLQKGNINLNGKKIDLGTAGYLQGETNQNRVWGTSGSVKAVRFINNPKISESAAGLGLCFQSSDNFGTTLIERRYGTQVSNGDNSISRYYLFSPATPVNIDEIKFTYLSGEGVLGQEGLYKIFTSLDGVDWRNKGGFPNLENQYVSSQTVSPPDLGTAFITLFPIESYATCLPNDSNYISAVFLAASEVAAGESVQFVNLSDPEPTTILWNFGNGGASTEKSPKHTYQLYGQPEDSFEVYLTVSNEYCSDTRKKIITVVPASPKKVASVYEGILNVNITPNPTDSRFKLEVAATQETEITMSLYDMQGVLMETRKAYGQDLKEEFSIGGGRTGMFLLKVQTGSQTRTLKVIKL